MLYESSHCVISCLFFINKYIYFEEPVIYFLLFLLMVMSKLTLECKNNQNMGVLKG